MRMIADCEEGKVDMVLSKSISRFARNTLDCLKYIRNLKALGIPIFFSEEGINTKDADVPEKNARNYCKKIWKRMP